MQRLEDRSSHSQISHVFWVCYSRVDLISGPIKIDVSTENNVWGGPQIVHDFFRYLVLRLKEYNLTSFRNVHEKNFFFTSAKGKLFTKVRICNLALKNFLKKIYVLIVRGDQLSCYIDSFGIVILLTMRKRTRDRWFLPHCSWVLSGTS